MATKSKKAAEKEVAAGADKKAAIESVMQRIERECGKGSIMRLGENASMNVSAVSNTIARTCSGVPFTSVPAVEIPPWNARRPPNFSFRYAGDMFAASGCRVSTARTPISMKSSNAQLELPQE